MSGHDDFVISAMIEEGVLDRAKVDSATRFALERGLSVCDALTAQGVLCSRDIALFRAEVSEYPYVDLSNYEIDIANTSILPRALAEQLCAFPLFVCTDLRAEGTSITVGMANPLDLRAVDQLRMVLKSDIDPVLCESESLRTLIARAYALTGEQNGASNTPTSAASDTLTTGREPIVAAINQIIAQGIELGVSDIHINPDEHALHLRYRVDGTLQTAKGPGLAAHSGLVQRLKVMADLDLTQTRRPQDGKFRFTHAGRTVDIRLSIIPTVCGENVVMRVLSSAANIRDLASLGFPTENVADFERLIESPYGMFLVTGPTGSGKTTSLYTALKRLNSPDVNIMTIEDPVEIRLPMIRQVQVNAEIGLSFAGALRSILRQDPDIVFVGEIRDEETARISLQAALTGHLVLSSLHTNDAAGAIPRLRDLGCPAFAVNAAVLAVIGQRLVKKTCTECARPYQPETAICARFAVENTQGHWVRGTGCGRCGSTGYRGRIGIYEMLKMSPELGRAVDRGASGAEVRELAVQHGMKLMWRDGLSKSRLGMTTLEEVNRVVAVQATECDPIVMAAPRKTDSGDRRAAA